MGTATDQDQLRLELVELRVALQSALTHLDQCLATLTAAEQASRVSRLGQVLRGVVMGG